MRFVKRPVAVFSFSFFLSFCVFARYNSAVSIGTLAVSFTAAVLFAVGGILLLKRGRGVFIRILAIVFAGVFFSLMFSYGVFVSGQEKYIKYEGKTLDVSGLITEVCYKGDGYGSYIFETDGMEGKGGITAVVECDAELDAGDVIKGSVFFERLGNGGSFDGKYYYMSKGAVLKGVFDDVRVIRRDYRSLKIKASRLNAKLYGTLTEKLSDRTSGVIGAVLLGNRSELSNEIRRDFSRIGISHLIAISGMHVSLMYSAISFLFGKAGVGRKPCAIITAVFMLFYMVLTGFSASVTRAVLLYLLTSVIILAGISHDGMTAVGVCASVMILAKPYFAFDIGMQLSFCAYIGCLAGNSVNKSLGFLNRMSEGRIPSRIIGHILSSFIFTAVVVIFTLPVSMLYFDSTSIIAPITNILFIPLFGVMLYAGILILVFSSVSPVYSLLSLAAEKYIGLIINIASKLASLKGITVSLCYSFAPYIVIIAAAAVAAAVCSKRKGVKYTAAAALCSCVVFYAAGAAFSHARLTERDFVCRVGTSSSEAFVAVSEGRAVICDVSSSFYSSMDMAFDRMRELNISEPEAVMLTGYGTGQLRSIKNLIGKYYINRAYLAYPSDGETDYYIETLRFLRSRGVEVILLKSGAESFTHGRMKITSAGTKYENSESKPTSSFAVETENAKLIYIGAADGGSAAKAFFDLGADGRSVVIAGVRCSDRTFLSLVAETRAKEIYLFGKDSAEAAAYENRGISRLTAAEGELTLELD